MSEAFTLGKCNSKCGRTFNDVVQPQRTKAQDKDDTTIAALWGKVIVHDLNGKFWTGESVDVRDKFRTC